MSDQIGIITDNGFHKTKAAKVDDVIISKKKLLWSSDDNPIDLSGTTSKNILEVDHSLSRKSIELVTSNGTHRIFCAGSSGGSGAIIYNTHNGGTHIQIAKAYISFWVNNSGTTTISGYAAVDDVDLESNTITQVAALSQNNHSFYIYRIYEIIE